MWKLIFLSALIFSLPAFAMIGPSLMITNAHRVLQSEGGGGSPLTNDALVSMEGITVSMEGTDVSMEN